MENMKYFEIEFADGQTPDEYIYIRGLREPSVDEAAKFCKADSEMIGMPVSNVYPIDEQTARACYDFRNVENWPVFGK